MARTSVLWDGVLAGLLILLALAFAIHGGVAAHEGDAASVPVQHGTARGPNWSSHVLQHERVSRPLRAEHEHYLKRAVPQVSAGLSTAAGALPFAGTSDQKGDADVILDRILKARKTQVTAGGDSSAWTMIRRGVRTEPGGKQRVETGSSDFFFILSTVNAT